MHRPLRSLAPSVASVEACGAKFEECFQDLRLSELILRNISGFEACGADFEECFEDLRLVELILRNVSRI